MPEGAPLRSDSALLLARWGRGRRQERKRVSTYPDAMVADGGGGRLDASPGAVATVVVLRAAVSGGCSKQEELPWA